VILIPYWCLGFNFTTWCESMVQNRTISPRNQLPETSLKQAIRPIYSWIYSTNNNVWCLQTCFWTREERLLMKISENTEKLRTWTIFGISLKISIGNTFSRNMNTFSTQKSNWNEEFGEKTAEMKQKTCWPHEDWNFRPSPKRNGGTSRNGS